MGPFRSHSGFERGVALSDLTWKGFLHLLCCEHGVRESSGSWELVGNYYNNLRRKLQWTE